MFAMHTRFALRNTIYLNGDSINFPYNKVDSEQKRNDQVAENWSDAYVTNVEDSVV